MNSPEDFRSTASIESLRRRAELLSRIRGFFDGQDFFEVETPILSADVVVDRHIEPISIPGDSVGNTNVPSDSGADLSNHKSVSEIRTGRLSQPRVHHVGVVPNRG